MDCTLLYHFKFLSVVLWEKTSYRVFNFGSNSQCLELEGSSSGQNHLQTSKFRTSLNSLSVPLFTMFQLHTTDNTNRGLTVTMEIGFWEGEVYRLCLHFGSAGWLGWAIWQLLHTAGGSWEACLCVCQCGTPRTLCLLFPGALWAPAFLCTSGFLCTSANACSVPALKPLLILPHTFCITVDKLVSGSSPRHKMSVIAAPFSRKQYSVACLQPVETFVWGSLYQWRQPLDETFISVHGYSYLLSLSATSFNLLGQF